jgi:type I protein arginine methyltransferase
MAAIDEGQRIIPAMLTSDLLEFHAFLTKTGSRLQQYATALERTVKPADTVLDLGAGLGVLSVLACRAGARHVYAVEASPVWALGQEVVRAAGLADRVTFTHGSSFELQLDEPVDVVVADVHAPFGLQDNGLSSLIDARDRLLKAGGAMVPSGLQLLVAPAEAADVYARRVDVWRQPVIGLDLATIRAAAVNIPYPARLREQDLLAPLQPLGEPKDLLTTADRHLGGGVIATIARAGTLHGLCGTIRSTLSAGVTLRNAPGDSDTTNFAHAFMPLDIPVPVAAGDRLDIDVDAFDGLESRWRVTLTTAAGQRRRFEHSTLFAGPLSSEELRRNSEDYRPRLTARGRVEHELLGRFDGDTPAASLRAWLEGQAGQALPSERARAALLKDAIARCG